MARRGRPGSIRGPALSWNGPAAAKIEDGRRTSQEPSQLTRIKVGNPGLMERITEDISKRHLRRGKASLDIIGGNSLAKSQGLGVNAAGKYEPKQLTDCLEHRARIPFYGEISIFGKNILPHFANATVKIHLE